MTKCFGLSYFIRPSSGQKSLKIKEKNIEYIELKNCWFGWNRCWEPKMLQCILSSCLLRRTQSVQNRRKWRTVRGFFNNGTTCIFLLYELFSLARSIVFVSSSMYDDVWKLASYKFSEECPCMFLWCIEVVRQIRLVMFYTTYGEIQGCNSILECV